MSLAQDIFETLIKDPDLDIQEGQTREDAAKSEAEYRARQYHNNVEALSLANEPVEKLLQHLIKYNDIKDICMNPLNIFKTILKGKVNDKDFDYDDKGLDEAIEYATQLMRDKKHVKFSWHDDYQQKNLEGEIEVDEKEIEELISTKDQESLQKYGALESALAGWWFGGTIADANKERNKLPTSQQREFDRQINESLRRKGKRFRKSSMQKVQDFFKNNEA